MIMCLERHLTFLFTYDKFLVLLFSMIIVKCSQKPVFHDLYLPDAVYLGSLDMCSKSPTVSQNNLY